MHSLFGRARTSSSKPSKSATIASSGPSTSIAVPYDEFGQQKLWPTQDEPRPMLPPKNGKTSFSSVRQRTISAPGLAKDLPTRPLPHELPPVPQLEAFHPLYIPEKKPTETGDRDYGYLAAENETILPLEEVERLVAVVGHEITSRALTTPLLFSSLALDVSANRVRSLIRSFLASCHKPTAPTGEAKWREDARLAGPHELGMLLRWGLARLLRQQNGQYVHGLLDIQVYLQWKVDEEALHFPSTHFPEFLNTVFPPLQPLLANLFDVFSRLAANSSQSGLTPVAISNLFGPLLFGLGPDNMPFSQTYAAYLRSSHATEHLILSYIRNIEVESRTTASAMPPRLKDWIRGYPVMIPPARDLEKPRRGCKLVKVASTRRNVRLYSSNLVKTGASWGSEGDMSGRKEWQRIASKTMPPKYSDEYRKRLDIPTNYAPSITSSESRSSLDMAYSTAPSSATNGPRSVMFGLSLDELGGADGNMDGPNMQTFRSLTDMRWGQFEEIGFSSVDTKALEFDLTEGARMTTAQKRTTLSWNDFSTLGFSRDDDPLSQTLQFSTPLASSISSWPSHAEEIHRKLKKTQKTLPTFGWDTSPVAGQEWIVEEGFVSCWADLLLSGGWMDKAEGTFRDANWALIEFKALPTSPTEYDPTATGIDPRTSSQWLLFEEFVPREYRDQLLNPPKKGAKTLFSSSKSWKPATTLNGKPYTGRPKSPTSHREAEFDAMLRSKEKTKIINLGGGESRRSQTSPDVQRIPLSNNYAVSSKGGLPPGTPERTRSSSPNTAAKEKALSPLARFKLPGSASKRKPSQYDPDLDFETRTASDSSGGENGSPSKGKHPMGGNHSRRHSKDDAWVDILVSSDRRRLGGQEAVFRNGITASPTSNHPQADYFTNAANKSGSLRTPRTSLTRARSDPEMGRDDVSRVGPEYQPIEVTVGHDPYGNRLTAMTASTGIRQSYGSTDDEEEEVMEVPRASYIESATRPAVRVQSPVIRVESVPAPAPRGRMSAFSDEADDEGDFEPASPISSAKGMSDIGDYSRPTSSGVLSPLRAVSPQPFPTEDEKPVTPTRKANAIGSLIEMYAKKDEEAAKAHYEPKASKLPVRSPSSSNTLPSAPSPSSTTPPDVSSPQPSTTHQHSSFEVADPINRMTNPSPARYVHGAPLHNVLEEAEEEV